MQKKVNKEEKQQKLCSLTSARLPYEKKRKTHTDIDVV